MNIASHCGRETMYAKIFDCGRTAAPAGAVSACAAGTIEHASHPSAAMFNANLWVDVGDRGP